jgi:hypothetical protein
MRAFPIAIAGVIVIVGAIMTAAVLEARSRARSAEAKAKADQRIDKMTKEELIKEGTYWLDKGESLIKNVDISVSEDNEDFDWPAHIKRTFVLFMRGELLVHFGKYKEAMRLVDVRHKDELSELSCWIWPLWRADQKELIYDYINRSDPRIANRCLNSLTGWLSHRHEFEDIIKLIELFPQHRINNGKSFLIMRLASAGRTEEAKLLVKKYHQSLICPDMDNIGILHEHIKECEEMKTEEAPPFRYKSYLEGEAFLRMDKPDSPNFSNIEVILNKEFDSDCDSLTEYATYFLCINDMASCKQALDKAYKIIVTQEKPTIASIAELAKLFFIIGDQEKSLKVIEKLPQKIPSSPIEFPSFIVEIFIRSGKYDKAIEFTESINHVAKYFYLCAALTEAGKKSLAEDIFKEQKNRLNQACCCYGIAEGLWLKAQERD